MKTRDRQLIYLYERLYNEVDEDYASEVIIKVIEKNLKIDDRLFKRRKEKYEVLREKESKYDFIPLDNIIYTYNEIGKKYQAIMICKALIKYIETHLLPKKDKLSKYEQELIEGYRRNFQIFVDYYDYNYSLEQLGEMNDLSRTRINQIILKHLSLIRRLIKYNKNLKDLF